MKMKDVIQKTGLTRRTVLYYEEQGLLTSEKTPMNGREYREYTDDHIQLLLDIAALRKAGFSIEEIRTMQHADSEVRPIFLAYRQRLAAQKEELNRLVQTVDAIPENNLDAMQDLLQGIRNVSAELPLPACDCTPHFRYLDEEEESLTPPQKEPALHTDAQPLEIDQDHLLNTGQLGYKKALDDLKEDIDEAPSRGVPNRSGGSFLFDIVEAILVLALLLVILDILPSLRQGLGSPMALRHLLLILVLGLLLAGVVFLENHSRR